MITDKLEEAIAEIKDVQDKLSYYTDTQEEIKELEDAIDILENVKKKLEQ
ncbi:hypothetical protein [Methanocaldococcus sp.]